MHKDLKNFWVFIGVVLGIAIIVTVILIVTKNKKDTQGPMTEEDVLESIIESHTDDVPQEIIGNVMRGFAEHADEPISDDVRQQLITPVE